MLFAPASLLARASSACRPPGRNQHREARFRAQFRSWWSAICTSAVPADACQWPSYRRSSPGGYQPGVISRGHGVQIDATPRVGQGRLDAHVFGDDHASSSLQTGSRGCGSSASPALSALLQARPEIDVIVSVTDSSIRTFTRDVEVVVQDRAGRWQRTGPARAGSLPRPACHASRIGRCGRDKSARMPPKPSPTGRLRTKGPCKSSCQLQLQCAAPPDGRSLRPWRIL